LDEAMQHSRNGHIALPVLARLLRAHGNEFEVAPRLVAFALDVVARLPLGLGQGRRHARRDLVTTSSISVEGDADGDL
jgi:hypothetical protein